MIRFILLLCSIHLCCSNTWAQCKIFKDQHGQIVTTCDVYRDPASQFATAAHKQINYLGSAYLTFPISQRGKVRLDKSGKEIACEVAYDVLANEVLCRFDGEATTKSITPYSFTINGVEFVRQVSTTLGVDYKIYSTVLYDGPTKLSRSLTRKLVQKSIPNGYEKKSDFDGLYETQERYYIRKGDAQPEITNLSKSSLLEILYDQSTKIKARLSGKKLTSGQVIEVLAYYDSLTVAAQVNKPPLSVDPVFARFLHEQIKYPGQAWNGSVYGRVYVGFEINGQGQLSTITTLSPENVGFGLNQEVVQALRKLSKVKADYAGKYVLPVAFTYTNSLAKTGPNVPVNTLPPDRYTDRIVLDELVVSIVASKTVSTLREVWGYYK